jgi:hypothetical protein
VEDPSPHSEQKAERREHRKEPERTIALREGPPVTYFLQVDLTSYLLPPPNYAMLF